MIVNIILSPPEEEPEINPATHPERRKIKIKERNSKQKRKSK